MGIGSAGGENRAVNASQDGNNQPLLEETSIDGAKGVLITSLEVPPSPSMRSMRQPVL